MAVLLHLLDILIFDWYLCKGFGLTRQLVFLHVALKTASFQLFDLIFMPLPAFVHLSSQILLPWYLNEQLKQSELKWQGIFSSPYWWPD